MNLDALDHYEKELYAYMDRTVALLPFANRLRTRLIVTNSLEAHLRPDAPKDVAVYYYVPGVHDANQLRLWRIAVIQTWIHYAEVRDHAPYVGGLRNGLLFPIEWLVTTIPSKLPPAEEEQVCAAGYNLIRFYSGCGYVLWGTTLWRDGVPKFPSPIGVCRDDPAYWSNRATPLALVY